MAIGHPTDSGHTQGDQSTMGAIRSSFTARDKMLPARLLGWHRARQAARLCYRPIMESGGVMLDSPRRRIQVDGYVVHLSARETAVLRALMTRAGRVVYRPVLAAAAWGGDVGADRCPLDRLMGQLRRRLEPSPLSPARLHRIGDTGYLFGLLAELNGNLQDDER
jgi:DNA-binding response OmpR family regulator